VKSLSSVVSANRVNANGLEGGECGNQYSFEERHSVIEEIKMDMIVRHRRTPTSAKWEEGKGKKVQYMINKQVIQNTTTGGGKVRAQRCAMVDTSSAELGDTRTQWCSKYGYVHYTVVQSTVTNCCTSKIICAKSASGTAEITTSLLSVSCLDIHHLSEFHTPTAE